MIVVQEERLVQNPASEERLHKDESRRHHEPVTTNQGECLVLLGDLKTECFTRYRYVVFCIENTVDHIDTSFVKEFVPVVKGSLHHVQTLLLPTQCRIPGPGYWIWFCWYRLLVFRSGVILDHRFFRQHSVHDRLHVSKTEFLLVLIDFEDKEIIIDFKLFHDIFNGC